jgi:hypothetical protein
MSAAFAPNAQTSRPYFTTTLNSILYNFKYLLPEIVLAKYPLSFSSPAHWMSFFGAYARPM